MNPKNIGIKKTKIRHLAANKFYFDPISQDTRTGRAWNKTDREGGEFWGGREMLQECISYYNPLTGLKSWLPDPESNEYAEWIKKQNGGY